jgi:hypothetical protein
MIAAALMTGALSSVAAQPSSSVLQSLPAEIQKDIETVRAACREHLADGNTEDQAWVIDDNDGLTTFTVSGRKAVMVDQGELCGGKGGKGITHTNRGSSWLHIYVRFGNAWRKALDTEAIGRIFLGTAPGTDEFKGLVLKVLLDALSGSAYDIDADHNGVITMNELTDYVGKHLSHLTGGDQQLGLDQRFRGDIFVAGL